MASKSSFADQELSFKALERLLSTLSLAKAGDFNVRMAAEGDGMEREVADTVNELLATLGDFTRELERVSESVTQGELRVRLPLDKANGGWGQQLRAINNIVVVFGKHAAEVRRVIKSIHGGDMSRPMNVGPESVHRGGELQRIAEEVNAMIAHLGRVTAEITRVFAEVGLDGRLNAQCHISDANGSWGLLVGSVNAASASLSEQVQDLCTTAQALAAGKLSARASVTSRGDLQTLKLGLNGAADGLSALCTELRRVAQEVVNEGKLGTELRHPDPRGEWQSAQDAVNRMLGTINVSWRNMLAEVERQAEGDYSSEPSHALTAPGELGAVTPALAKLSAQGEHIHESMRALIDGRFGELRPAAGGGERELILLQLGLRLKREWFRSVRAAIYEVREQENDAPAFAQAVLGALAHNCGASAGAYYTVGDDKRLIRLVNLGCDTPEQESPLKLGEGLIGKVALDAKPMLLDKLDQKGLRLRSGLLEITPRSALIFPVLRQGSVRAVIELLFVDNAGATALELLEYLAPDLAKGPILTAAPPQGADKARMRELEEELVIANARLQQLANELKDRDRALRATGS